MRKEQISDIVLAFGLCSDDAARGLYDKCDGNPVSAVDGILEASGGVCKFELIEIVNYWRESDIKGPISCFYDRKNSGKQ